MDLWKALAIGIPMTLVFIAATITAYRAERRNTKTIEANRVKLDAYFATVNI